LAQWSPPRSLHRYRGRPEVSLIGAKRRGQTTFVNDGTGLLKPEIRVDLRSDGNRYRKRSPTTCCAARHIQGRFQIPQLFIELTAGPKIWRGGLGHAHAGAFISFPARKPRRRDKGSSCWNVLGLAISQDRPISELAGRVRQALVALRWRWSAA